MGLHYATLQILRYSPVWEIATASLILFSRHILANSISYFYYNFFCYYNKYVEFILVNFELIIKHVATRSPRLSYCWLIFVIGHFVSLCECQWRKIVSRNDEGSPMPTGAEIGNAFARFLKISSSPPGVSQRARPQNNKRARPSR